MSSVLAESQKGALSASLVLCLSGFLCVGSFPFGITFCLYFSSLCPFALYAGKFPEQDLPGHCIRFTVQPVHWQFQNLSVMFAISKMLKMLPFHSSPFLENRCPQISLKIWTVSPLDFPSISCIAALTSWAGFSVGWSGVSLSVQCWCLWVVHSHLKKTV